MASVRAKFTVESVERTQQNRYPHKTENGQADYSRPEPVEIHTVKLRPVYSEDPKHENKAFWDATPSGRIELDVINPEAHRHFELGKSYYVDFTPAE